MAWLFLFAFLFTGVPALQAQDTTRLQAQSEEQVRHYVDAVNRGKQVDINLWALAEISRDVPQLTPYIHSYIQQKAEPQPALQLFADTTLSHSGRLKQLSFTAESPLLLVSYLLAETQSEQRKAAAARFAQQIGYPPGVEAVDYPALVQALLNQAPVTEAMLSPRRFHPLHFVLFLNTSVLRRGTFSPDYLRTAGDRWSFPGNPTLKQALGTAAQFMTYFVLDRYDKIEPLYRDITAQTLFPNSVLKVNLLRWLDYSMFRLGYYHRGLGLIQGYSLPLARYLGNENLAVNLQIKKAINLYYIGKVEQSKRAYLDILSTDRNSSAFSKARVYNNLATTYWKSGEFDPYLSLQFQALEAAQKEKNYKLRFDIYQNLFTHYRVNKDYDSANNYLEKAKQLATQEQNIQDLAKLTYYEGQLYRDSESDYAKAIASFNEALNLISFEKNYHSYQNLLLEKAQLFEKQNKHHGAKQIYNQVLDEAVKRNDNRNSNHAAFSKANIHLALGQMDSAHVMMDTLDSRKLNALDFYQLVKARTVQARYRQQTDRPDEAIEILQPVIDQIVQRSRSSGDLETGFWQVEPEYLDAFERFANLLIATGRPGQAVEALDRLKTINDAALYQNPLVRSKVLNEKELSDYKRLTENLDGLRKQLLTATGKRQDNIQQTIDEKSARKSALERKITANADIKPASVNDIQRRMSARERVLHLTELNGTYYLAIIERTGVQFTKIPITPAVRNNLEQAVAGVAAGNTDLEKLHTVSRLLNIGSLPDHVEKLTIIPDSYLFQLPLDILPVAPPAEAKSYGDAEYLIERFRTNYKTSLNDFNAPASNRNAYSLGFAGFGVSRFDSARTRLVPLPEAQNEIKTIAEQLAEFDERKVFLNASATEQSFRQSAPKARILHMATHSEVSGRDPLFSSIYLSRTDQEDEEKFPGRIFAYELFELNLQNELIMLNSCESGSGSYLQGTGVVGISRALCYAGAKSLVLNLWSVNDMMASDFSAKFYEGINEGQTKSEALRNAKLYFLKTKNANPHYWGSYMLLGNEDAMVEPNRRTKNIVAASFMIFFFSLAIASSILEWRRRSER